MDSVPQSSPLPLSVLRARSSLLCLVSAMLVCFSLSSIPAAWADRADQHYKRALKYYDSKDYPNAIKEFQAAYRVRQLPKILLNIGQVYRKLGMASTALKFYKHYLRVEPNPRPEIKSEVDRYIAQTEAMLDPPEFVAPPSGTMSAAEAAAAAVAAAPSNVTSVTVPELYSDDDLQSLNAGEQPGGADHGKVRRPAGTSAGTRLEVPANKPLLAPVHLAQPQTAPPLLFAKPKNDSPPAPKTPIYKEPWFWGLVGGVAGAVVITGVAIGVQRQTAVPPDILYPTK